MPRIESGYQDLLIRVFTRLRRQGFSLGIGELRAALRLLDGEWPFDNLAQLQQDVRLLWCHSWVGENKFNEVWAEEEQARTESDRLPITPPPAEKPLDRRLAPERASDTPSRRGTEEPIRQMRESFVSAMPLKLPSWLEGPSEMSVNWPLSRRAMAYGWQYLRRSRADGPATLMDLEATIEQMARHGFFVAPVFRRRMRNHAHLIILLDRFGSMTPFHALTLDLVETVRQMPTLERVEVYYFHNHLADSLCKDAHLNEPEHLDCALANCQRDTSVLIVSDAGAARGHLSVDRVRATGEMLLRLRQRTSLLAWLNPMPRPRWLGTSAQLIERLIPMFHLDQTGLTDAVKIVRGQTGRSGVRRI
jgi:uncharacterized protein with von Willebrand factor type A (vWA) domain